MYTPCDRTVLTIGRSLALARLHERLFIPRHTSTQTDAWKKRSVMICCCPQVTGGLGFTPSQVLIVNDFSPGTHTCTPTSSILIYGGLIIKWSRMWSHCPHIALNGYMNLGHICMPAPLDYVEWPTWWFKAITHRRHRSNVSSGYIRGFFIFIWIFLIFVVQISGTDWCLSHAPTAIYPLLLPVFFFFFSFFFLAGFSLWRRGSKRRDFPYRKHSADRK